MVPSCGSRRANNFARALHRITRRRAAVDPCPHLTPDAIAKAIAKAIQVSTSYSFRHLPILAHEALNVILLQPRLPFPSPHRNDVDGVHPGVVVLGGSLAPPRDDHPLR